MYELRYVGRSPYGISIHLANRRSVVTVSKRTPFKLGSNLTDQEIRYYKSLLKCDIELVEPPVQEVAPEEVVVEVEEVVADEPAEVVDVQSIYDQFVDELTDEDVDDLCDQLKFSSRKRNKGKKLWDLLTSDHADDAIQILLNR